MKERHFDRYSLHPQVTVRVLPIPSHATWREVPHRTEYGYISKVYALLLTNFSTAFFFDSDTWYCNGWSQAVDQVLRRYPDSNVFWTLEDTFGDYWGQNNTLFTSEEISCGIEEFSEFYERNSGTIFGIRKNKASERFLKRAIDVWHTHQNSTKYRAWIPEISSTDQGALREAAFIELGDINGKS